MKTPTSPESVLKVVFVAVFVTTILAFGMVAPVLSFTTPVRIPAADWANRANVTRRKHKSARKAAFEHFIE